MYFVNVDWASTGYSCMAYVATNRPMFILPLTELVTQHTHSLFSVIWTLV